MVKREKLRRFQVVMTIDARDEKAFGTFCLGIMEGGKKKPAVSSKINKPRISSTTPQKLIRIQTASPHIKSSLPDTPPQPVRKRAEWLSLISLNFRA